MIIMRTDNHTHGPNVPKIEAEKIVQEIRECARTTQEATRQIIATTVTADEATSVHLPAKFSLNRMVQ